MGTNIEESVSWIFLIGCSFFTQKMMKLYTVGSFQFFCLKIQLQYQQKKKQFWVLKLAHKQFWIFWGVFWVKYSKDEECEEPEEWKKREQKTKTKKWKDMTLFFGT